MGNVSDQVGLFVARIARVRGVREMSQQDLADACGLSRQVVSKIETGRQAVGLDDALLICKALDVPLTDMLSEQPMVLIVRVPVD